MIGGPYASHATHESGDVRAHRNKVSVLSQSLEFRCPRHEPANLAVTSRDS